MMTEVQSKQRFALIGTVLGLVNKDIPMVINNLKELDFFPPETNTTVIVEALNEALFKSTDGGEGSSLNFTKLNENLNSISRTLPLRLPPFYSLIIRTLTILEGLALSVDSEFRLIRGAYPFIAKQILTSNSPELQSLLRSVLLDSSGKIRWNKLEQFLSIASNADLATKGNFNALKRAQDRSDPVRTYTDTQIKSNFTTDATLQIIDFLTSDNGKFLREPLVDEVVDALGIE
jgi:predicted unusual protein kinase regulating ubiquinone biosynthesis (AarF/ABC1/UbiB family)